MNKTTPSRGKKVKEKGWAIRGVHGFYVGWWLTRRDAIETHTGLLEKSWAYCRRKGDRAVPVLITELPSKTSKRSK